MSVFLHQLVPHAAQQTPDNLANTSTNTDTITDAITDSEESLTSQLTRLWCKELTKYMQPLRYVAAQNMLHNANEKTDRSKLTAQFNEIFQE